jgi:hypothetical protein
VSETPDTKKRIALLEERGVVVTYDSIWSGRAGLDRRQRPNHQHIRGVFLPLSGDEWCYICQRDSEGYIGPCCGNTGMMQDILNGVFRDSGYFEDKDLIQIGVNATSHEGFDSFPDGGMNEEEFSSWMSRWENLEPWDKIGLLYQGLEPLLHWGWVDNARLSDNPDELDDQTRQKKAMRTLEHGLRVISWSDMWSDDDEFKQRHANRLIALARLLEPAQIIASRLAESVEKFEGVGIVAKETGEVITNGYGYCIYSDAAEAKRFLEMMTRWEKEEREEGDDPILREDEFIANRVVIKPVKVSVAKGIEVL